MRGAALRAAFAGADIFCLPSIEEGFALAILEAMAAGLPVVATEATGCGEALDDGAEGLVVADRDAVAITQARDRVEREFGWRRYGERALAIYRRVLGAT